MESYPDPNPNAGDRADAYYTSTSNAIAQLQEENMMNMGHNIAPAMHGQGGIPDQQDSRSHDQINQSFQNSSQLPHHLNSQGHIQSGHGGLAQIPLHYDSPEASGSARKRSKVSRACDECRRKKIKCDAQSEEGPCSNCRRSSVECQFSRVPQKRGPSKGYINALEKRVRALEHTSHDGIFDTGLGGEQHMEDVMSGTPRDDFGSRKRTFSNANQVGELASPYQQQHRPLAPASPWQPPQQPFPPNHASRPSESQNSQNSGNEDHNFARPNYSIQDVFPNPLSQSTTSHVPEPSRLSASYHEGNNANIGGVVSEAQSHTADDEHALNGYYQFIHPSLPLLSDDRQSVFGIVSTCPNSLIEAFYGALHAACRAIVSSDLSSSDSTHTQITADLLTRCELDDPLRTFQARLVYVQALTLMSLEAQCRTHNPLLRQTGGSLSRWLGSAVTNALEMKLYSTQPQEGTEIDNEAKVARQLWLSLCVLERIACHSTGIPTKISEDYFQFSRQDVGIVGEPLFHLARLSSVLGLMAQMNAHENNNHTDAPFTYGLFPRRLLDFWEQDHPPVNSPELHVMYWHVKLLVILDIKTTSPKALQAAAIKIMELIVHNNGLVGPLSIYFTGLLVLVLVELLRYESTKHDGQRSLKLLKEKSYYPAGWEPIIRKMVEVIDPPEALDEVETSGSQNLRRLANVAIAETEKGRTVEGRSDNEQAPLVESSKQWTFEDFKELRSLARHGYMNVFNPTR